jgi:ubiquinone/menaquinone biosynthesis C-methylase UbiE
MDRMKLYDIAERYMELINPFDSQKIKTLGKSLGLKEGSKVIEFGCGFAENMVIWAETYGIEAVGMDIREYAYERAIKKIEGKGLSDRLKVFCEDGAKFQFEKGAYDVAACIGASFIWGDYRSTIKAMKEAINPKGKLVIGEPYSLKEPIPPEYEEGQGIHTEHELLQIARDEGFDFEYMVRASHDDWDRYEATNWLGLVKWLEENSDHPDRLQVKDWFYKIQDEYLKYGREYLGWAVYILNPIRY